MSNLTVQKLEQIAKLAQDLLLELRTEQICIFDVRQYAENGSPRRDLNFKVPADFHRLLKISAVSQGILMKELLVQMAQCWMDYKADNRLRERLKALLDRRHPRGKSRARRQKGKPRR